jgi:hypothetical protein
MSLAKSTPGEKEKSKWVYVCPWTNLPIEPDDERLTGLGNPPRSPHEPVGAGSVPMTRVPRSAAPKDPNA